MSALTSTTYVTRAGDMLDLICRRRYGSEKGTVENVLAFNRHLADVLASTGPALPAGLEIALPDLPKPAPRQRATVNLWD